jgi:hypothetical protein
MFGMDNNSAASSVAGPAGAYGPFPDRNAQLSDADIRAALVGGGFVGLVQHHCVLEEVECWRGYVRADYVCLSDDALSIIEIKSDRDTLRRFEEQVRVYSAIADRVTLVVGWSLAAHALRAAPAWWDVLLAERDAMSSIRFIPLRDGARNSGVATTALVAMLPIDEVRRLARSTAISGSRLRGRELRRLVAARVSGDDLRVAVCDWLARLSQQRTRTPPSAIRASES